MEGYRPRFGIVRVDANPREALRRYPKLSAYWLSQHFFKRAPGEIACLGAGPRRGAGVPRVCAALPDAWADPEQLGTCGATCCTRLLELSRPTRICPPAEMKSCGGRQ